ncbi:hypothetical protein Rhopal_002383-T1 [Rhodotorula paludigena]|uniref:Transcriptional repressor Tup1 N-terminal domain-containing protein n=1 Tax=Rhodotorula paludigena TaxID=86838 RepID=A0AAV5GGU1_9BASI|nr:hypothetical protein Rhopal_002383-T1 [Rhodotorula paludigena]
MEMRRNKGNGGEGRGEARRSLRADCGRCLAFWRRKGPAVAPRLVAALLDSLQSKSLLVPRRALSLCEPFLTPSTEYVHSSLALLQRVPYPDDLALVSPLASRGVYDHRPLGAVSLAPGAVPPGSGSGPSPGGPTGNPPQGPPPPGAHPASAAAAAAAAAGHPLNGLMHAGPPGPGAPPGGIPAGAVVGVVAPPHPSAQRLNDLLEFVKAEFEQVAGEGSVLRAQREEYEAMIHTHASELNAMRAMVYDLERKYHDDKRVLQDENSRLQEENSRLRQQLDSSRSSISSTGVPSASGRPTLPPMISPAPGARPGSAGIFAGRDGEYGAGTNGRDSAAGEHPSKRLRVEDEERRKSATSVPPPQRLGPGPAPYGGSRPPSTGPGGAPPLHHPSPLPAATAAAALPALSSASNAPSPQLAAASVPSATPTPAAASSSSTAVKDEKPSESAVQSFDPDTAPKDLKKEGSDWLTMFNPNVKRVLDVGLVHTLVHDSVVCCVRFSPDGKTLATGCNRNTTLYDTKTGAKIAVLFDESSSAKADNYIRSAAFSPDGKLLATGSEDRIVRIWNLSQKRISQVFQGHKSEIYSLAFSPDGRRLVSGSGDKTAKMWDLATGSLVYTLLIDDITIAENGPVDAGVTSVVFSPDGQFLACGSLDTMVRIWDAETGKLLDKLKGHRDSVYSVAFSPDGKFLVSGSLDKTLKMFDMGSLRAALAAGGKDQAVGEGGKTTCLTTLQGHKDYVLSVDISPDGAWIVSGSKDRGVQFWDPKTAKAQFMLQGHKNSVISVSVSPAGGLMSTASGDWSAKVWRYDRIA